MQLKLNKNENFLPDMKAKKEKIVNELIIIGSGRSQNN